MIPGEKSSIQIRSLYLLLFPPWQVQKKSNKEHNTFNITFDSTYLEVFAEEANRNHLQSKLSPTGKSKQHKKKI